MNSKTKTELFAFTIVITFFCSMLIWIRTVTVKETYSYVQYEKELRHLQQEIQETKVKWLSLTTPKRLELISKVLDLRSTDPSQILLYEPSTTEKP